MVGAVNRSATVIWHCSSLRITFTSCPAFSESPPMSKNDVVTDNTLPVPTPLPFKSSTARQVYSICASIALRGCTMFCSRCNFSANAVSLVSSTNSVISRFFGLLEVLLELFILFVDILLVDVLGKNTEPVENLGDLPIGGLLPRGLLPGELVVLPGSCGEGKGLGVPLLLLLGTLATLVIEYMLLLLALFFVLLIVLASARGLGAALETLFKLYMLVLFRFVLPLAALAKLYILVLCMLESFNWPILKLLLLLLLLLYALRL
mmetsp:Transcript_6230/g.10461  ORF Transcript_6230/g.10461 Transcript_6230/m.10461 type:complete len:263 (-) Transcript_6230:2232-3020(-)